MCLNFDIKEIGQITIRFCHKSINTHDINQSEETKGQIQVVMIWKSRIIILEQENIRKLSKNAVVWQMD